MKAKLCLLAAAASLLTGATAHAAPTTVDQFLDGARASAEQQLVTAGVDLKAPVTVKGYISGDGRLRSVHVVRSSGSRDADYAVTQALRKMPVKDVPPLLVGASVTLALGQPAVVQAKAP